MSLSSSVTDLATRIASYIKTSVMPRLLPAGGAAGQVLAKSSAADYSTAWVQGWTSANFTPGNYAPIIEPQFKNGIQILPSEGSVASPYFLFKGGSNSTLGGAGFYQDTYGSVIRWFEAGGAYRGFYVDVAECGAQSALWHMGNQTFSNSANGYLRLQNGFILQWGTVSASPNDVFVTFPTAFYGATHSVLATSVNAEVNNVACVVSVDLISSSSFALRRRKITDGSVTVDTTSVTKWIAIGN